MAEKYIECDHCDCTESEWYDEDCEAHYYQCYQCGGTTNVWKEAIGFLDTYDVEIEHFEIDERDEEDDYTKYYVVADVDIEDQENDIYTIKYIIGIDVYKGEYKIDAISRKEEDEYEFDEDFDDDLLKDEKFQKYTIAAFKAKIL